MSTYKEPFDKKFRGDELGNLAAYRNGRPHRGQDWHPKEKSPIPAITGGKVVLNTWTDVLGHILVQATEDGKYMVLYAHLAAKPEHKLGHILAMGDTVGLVGGGKNTPSGSASTGAHLHMSVSHASAGKNVHLVAYDQLVDPLKLFK